MQLKRLTAAIAFFAGLVFVTEACHRHVAAIRPTPLPEFHSPSGKVYARTHIAGPDNDEPAETLAVAPGAAPNVDTFAGTARKAAKLSIASGTPQSFNDLADLLHSLPADSTMRAKNISKTPDSGRLPEEQKVVTVTAFLYASSKESDNDFHCVVGRAPGKPAQFMNVEVSALPASSSQFFAALRKARNEFKQFFTSNNDSLPAAGYDKFDPPIAITLTGSLFFDVDHVPPAVGPTGMKPKTAWEIHPVTDIQFEQ
jgi:hypothetical protein